MLEKMVKCTEKWLAEMEAYYGRPLTDAEKLVAGACAEREFGYIEAGMEVKYVE